MRPSSQRGVALVISLILLVVITMIALTTIRFSTQELNFASNDTLKVEAFESAQSLVDATIATPANTPVVGQCAPVPYTVCLPGQTCNGQSTLALADGWLDSEIAAGNVTIQVQRVCPNLGPPPRGFGTSVVLFSAANFSVQAMYNMSSQGQGRTGINEGVIVLVPKGF